MQGKDFSGTNARKRELSLQRVQKASDMEVTMLIVAVVPLVGAAFAFLSYGLLAGLALLILSALAFGLSKFFDLVGDLLFETSKTGEEVAPAQSETQLPE